MTSSKSRSSHKIEKEGHVIMFIYELIKELQDAHGKHGNVRIKLICADGKSVDIKSTGYYEDSHYEESYLYLSPNK